MKTIFFYFIFFISRFFLLAGSDDRFIFHPLDKNLQPPLIWSKVYPDISKKELINNSVFKFYPPYNKLKDHFEIITNGKGKLIWKDTKDLITIPSARYIITQDRRDY